jgi:hypothetical protein
MPEQRPNELKGDEITAAPLSLALQRPETLSATEAATPPSVTDPTPPTCPPPLLGRHPIPPRLLIPLAVAVAAGTFLAVFISILSLRQGVTAPSAAHERTAPQEVEEAVEKAVRRAEQERLVREELARRAEEKRRVDEHAARDQLRRLTFGRFRYLVERHYLVDFKSLNKLGVNWNQDWDARARIARSIAEADGGITDDSLADIHPELPAKLKVARQAWLALADAIDRNDQGVALAKSLAVDVVFFGWVDEHTDIAVPRGIDGHRVFKGDRSLRP